MAQAKAASTPIDPQQLTPQQVQQLRFVLEILTLHQLVHVAALIKRLCAQPGYGKIAVMVRDGHPDTIEIPVLSEKLLPRMDAEELEALMGDQPAP
jgi:hypothetical protein